MKSISFLSLRASSYEEHLSKQMFKSFMYVLPRFSNAQVISMVMFALGLVVYFVLATKKERPISDYPDPEPAKTKGKRSKEKKEKYQET